jgi:hypothetical protein
MRAFLLLGAAFLVGGCGALPERLSQRFSTPTPKERIIESPQAEVFDAVQQTMTRLNYQVTRAAQAQGIVNGQSRLLPTERFGSSDQYVLEVRLRELDGQATSLSAILYEQSEGQFQAGATSTPVREHGRYEMFFDVLEQVLAESTAD